MKGRPLWSVPIRQYQVVLNAAWLRSCRSCILYVLHQAGRKNTDVVVVDLNADLTRFNQSDHPLPVGSIKVRAGVAVVYVNAVFDTMQIGLLRHIMPGKGLVSWAFAVQSVHLAVL